MTITAVMTKLIDKLPWGKIFGGSKKVPVYKTHMDLAIAEHSIECRKCTDKRFEDAIKELKESRAQEAELRKLDIDERREFRKEILNSNTEFRKEMVDALNRVHLRIDGKADK